MEVNRRFSRFCYRTSEKDSSFQTAVEVLFDIMMFITDGALLWCLWRTELLHRAQCRVSAFQSRASAVQMIIIFPCMRVNITRRGSKITAAALKAWGIMWRKSRDLHWRSFELFLVGDLDQRKEMRTTAGFKTEGYNRISR